MEAAGEPEEAFETCLTTVISLPRQLPVHQGQKGLWGLLQQRVAHQWKPHSRLPIQYELTLALAGRVSRSPIPVQGGTGRNLDNV
jgi:hypothetical protein